MTDWNAVDSGAQAEERGDFYDRLRHVVPAGTQRLGPTCMRGGEHDWADADGVPICRACGLGELLRVLR